MIGPKVKIGFPFSAVGDEGGFAPNILSNREGLLLVKEAIVLAGHTDKVEYGMDVAASEFWMEGEKKYDLDFKTPNSAPEMKKTADEMIAMYNEFVEYVLSQWCFLFSCLLDPM